MNQLPIDFAPPGLRRTLHRTTRRAWVLGVVGLTLCAVAGVLGGRMLARQKADDAMLEAARVRANVPVVVAVASTGPRVSEQQAAVVNAAVMQLNLPWRALQDAIGAATPPAIAMLALEPDARKRSMKITAEAKSSDAMIDYVEKLKEQELFANVALTRHEINEQDPARPIRFQIEAEWIAP
ncbi:PilN domain-containing protein [Massilia sp. TSP1-1-2]|uniref:PilN domain-containing protein n=1 Tax=unclassified Massilia TaxID=2609279 RepID=UPI003CF517AC